MRDMIIISIKALHFIEISYPLAIPLEEVVLTIDKDNKLTNYDEYT